MNPYDIFMSPADRAACRCGEGDALPTAAVTVAAPGASAMPSLAMVYAKLQSFEGVYSHEEALSRGTLFEELDLPFYGGKRGISK
jgi:hypothetical protein